MIDVVVYYYFNKCIISNSTSLTFSNIYNVLKVKNCAGILARMIFGTRNINRNIKVAVA